MIFVPNTNLIVYCASKSYVSAFSLGLREELKDRRINVCLQSLFRIHFLLNLQVLGKEIDYDFIFFGNRKQRICCQKNCN